MLGSVVNIETLMMVNTGVECFWVRMRGRAKKADMTVCYRLPNQDGEAGEIFCKQVGEISRSLALALLGEFNLPGISWEHNRAEREESWRFLGCVGINS